MNSVKGPFLSDEMTRYAKGGLSRRQFITSALAAGVALPAALGWADKVLAATPNKGGLFRLGVSSGSTTDSLDPATYEGIGNGIMGYMYANNLVEVDYSGNLQPELAESFESSDGVTWVFKLRQGVEFHNGKTLTADDVIASINHHRGPDSKSAAKGPVKQIKDIRADGNSVVFELTGASADFPFVLNDTHLLILPSKDGKIDPLSGIGTGGYTITAYEPGVRVHGKRNPNYFKEGRAHFDEVEVLSIIDSTARQNALMNGDVDTINQVDPKTVTLLGRVPTLDILERTSGLHYSFPMRCDAPPYDNPDLRMAIKLAVKRQELVDKILLGHGALGNDNPIATFQPVPCGPPAARVRRRTGQVLLQEIGPQRGPEAFVGGRGLCGRGGCRTADCRLRGRMRDQCRSRARAQRRLLVQRMEQEALVREPLERSPDGRLDVLVGIHRRDSMERNGMDDDACRNPFQQDHRRGEIGARQ